MDQQCINLVLGFLQMACLISSPGGPEARAHTLGFTSADPCTSEMLARFFPDLQPHWEYATVPKLKGSGRASSLKLEC